MVLPCLPYATLGTQAGNSFVGSESRRKAEVARSFDRWVATWVVQGDLMCVPWCCFERGNPKNPSKPMTHPWAEWYIYLHENHKHQPNVGKYTIHGWYGKDTVGPQNSMEFCWLKMIIPSWKWKLMKRSYWKDAFDNIFQHILRQWTFIQQWHPI